MLLFYLAVAAWAFLRYLHTFRRQLILRPIRSIIAKAKHSRKQDLSTFRHPPFSAEELHNGTRLGIDTWADTGCSGKHAYVEKFIEGKSVNVGGFSNSLGSLDGIPFANVLYACDLCNGTVVLLEHTNTIYLGKDMNDSLANPIQCEKNGVRIDIRPKAYYNDATAQSMTFPDGTVIPI